MSNPGWVYYQFKTDIANGHDARFWRVQWSNPPKIEWTRDGGATWRPSMLMSTVPFGPDSDGTTVEVPDPSSGCDGQPTCSAERHWVQCLGLYVTEDELRDCVWPTDAELERRRRDQITLTRLGHGRTQP